MWFSSLPFNLYNTERKGNWPQVYGWQPSATNQWELQWAGRDINTATTLHHFQGKPRSSFKPLQEFLETLWKNHRVSGSSKSRVIIRFSPEVAQHRHADGNVLYLLISNQLTKQQRQWGLLAGLLPGYSVSQSSQSQLSSPTRPVIKCSLLHEP